MSQKIHVVGKMSIDEAMGIVNILGLSGMDVSCKQLDDGRWEIAALGTFRSCVENDASVDVAAATAYFHQLCIKFGPVCEPPE